MSDDFMSEISDAVAATSAPVTTNVTTPAQPSPTQEVNSAVNTKQPNSMESVVADLEKSFGDEPEEVAKPEAKPVAKEAEKGKEKIAKPDPKGQNNKPTARYLDTFLKEDANGNFVTASGEVIATAGKSREYLEGLKREGRAYRDAANRTAMSNVQLAEKFKELYTEYATVRDSKNTFDWTKETGFAPNEANEVLTIMREYKKDPINAIKMLLTSAKASGIDLSKIGANVTADPAVIKNMVQELLAEQVAPLRQNAQQEQLIARAKQEIQNFYAQYPDAEQYETNIALAKQQFPNMSLPEIWLRLERAIIARDQAQPKRLSLKERFAPKQQTGPVTRRVTMPTTPDFTKMSFQEIAELTEKELTNGQAK